MKNKKKRYEMSANSEDIRRAVEAYDMIRAQRIRNKSCLRCGSPERANRYHCEQCHDECKD